MSSPSPLEVILLTCIALEADNHYLHCPVSDSLQSQTAYASQLGWSFDEPQSM